MITSEELIDAINYGGDVYKIAKALRGPNCPKQAQEVAAKSGKWELRCAVAEGRANKALLGYLAKDRSIAVKAAVANNENTPAYGIDILLENNDTAIDVVLCGRKRLSPKQFQVLFSRGTSRQVELAKNKFRSEEEYAQLARGPLLVRVVLARNYAIGKEVQSELVKDIEVIPHLVLNKNLDDEIFRRIPPEIIVEGRLLKKSEYERKKWELEDSIC